MADPVLYGVDDVTFTENLVNGAPQLLAPGQVLFSDADEDLDGAVLVVSGLLAEDTVSIRNQGGGAGQIGYDSGTGEISFGGVVIGIAGGGAGGDLTITLDADATSEAVQALIANLTYANSSDAPTATRDLTINLTDAGGHDIAFLAPDFVRDAGASPAWGPGGDTYNANPELKDLDGDGDLDLLVGHDNGAFDYFENQGDATTPNFVRQFGADNPFDFFNFASRECTGSLVDIDNDGDYDLLAGTYYNSDLRFFENTGDASNPVFVQRTGAANPFAAININGAMPDTAFADMDDDGDLDMVLAANAGHLRYFENTGTVSAAAWTERTGAANAFDVIYFGNMSSTYYFPTPEIADLDGDGDLDLVVGSYTGGTRIFYNTGSPETARFEYAGVFLNSFPLTYRQSAPASGDIDNDGDIDLLIGVEFYANSHTYRNDPTAVHGRTFTVSVTAEAEAVIGDSTGNTLAGTPDAEVLQGLDGDDTIDGGAGDDTIEGGEGDDWLKGNTGADRLYGGIGDDTYIVDNAGDATDETGGDGVDLVWSRITWTLGAGLENLLLAAPGYAIDGFGNDLNNLITGNDFNNVLAGGAGDDTLLGNGRNDTLYGEAGEDILDGGAQDDLLFAGDDDDSLTGGLGADTLYGENGADTLDAGAGHDHLDGGAGPDQMTGGSGNDVYIVDDALDVVIEGVGEGADTIRAFTDVTMADNVESMVMDGSGFRTGRGNASNNTIQASDWGAELFGEGGNDVLLGFYGTDTFHGGAGNDHLNGGYYDDVLHGDEGADFLYGGEGFDTLIGGAGNDMLHSSVSYYSDRYVFTNADIKLSSLGQTIERDRVYGMVAMAGAFNAGGSFDLSGIDADISTAQDDAFHWAAGNRFHGVAGELRILFSNNDSTIEMDVDGDGKADFRITVEDHNLLGTTGFTSFYIGMGGWVL